MGCLREQLQGTSSSQDFKRAKSRVKKATLTYENAQGIVDFAKDIREIQASTELNWNKMYKSHRKINRTTWTSSMMSKKDTK